MSETNRSCLYYYAANYTILTCIVDLTVELLGVVCLNDNLLLYQILHGTLDQRVFTSRLVLLSILYCSASGPSCCDVMLIMYQQELLLYLFRQDLKLGLLPTVTRRSRRGIRVHLRHMCQNFRVIVQTFAFGFTDDRHHFALRKGLFPMILLEWIIMPHSVRRFL